MTQTPFTELWEELAIEEGGRIVYVVMDGLGGLPNEAGKTGRCIIRSNSRAENNPF